MRPTRVLGAGIGLCLLVLPLCAQSPRRVTKVADGVYAIEHRDAQDGFAGGNTTVIIGERQVLVVDAPFRPSEAREDIAQIRQWTDKPVAFVVTTHFHNDHNLGNRAYMDAFPSVSFLAHAETKTEMDLFGPGSRNREQRGTEAYQRMLDSGKGPDGAVFSAADVIELKSILARRQEVATELDATTFQSATMTFESYVEVDLGNRPVQVSFLGRGNTSGDAVVYLPRERVAAVGDLVVTPMPYFYDGYPREWTRTLRAIVAMQPSVIVPGHGAVLRDTSRVVLIAELLQSAVGQVTEALRTTGPAMFRTVEAIRDRVDLSSFRVRFAGRDAQLAAAFDQAVAQLVGLVFREASLR